MKNPRLNAAMTIDSKGTTFPQNKGIEDNNKDNINSDIVNLFNNRWIWTDSFGNPNISNHYKNPLVKLSPEMSILVQTKHGS